ncbi:MAG: maleylacetoacetate isomerase [Alphaproteobacteria bacterium]|nr:maleylacetoacetate isomerase [Alphaproteobacteria bacterium]
MSNIILYDYWRSSASYRVRITLHLKRLEFESRSIDLLAKANKQDEYMQYNPQGLLPTLVIGDIVLTQSVAIIDYLDSYQASPRLIPTEPEKRAWVLSLAYAIAMEIHPICNLAVIGHAASLISDDETQQTEIKKQWQQHFISKGLQNIENMLIADTTHKGKFACGDDVSLVECCLIPQIYNAKRWDVDYSDWHNISAINERAEKIPAFIAAHPDRYNI